MCTLRLWKYELPTLAFCSRMPPLPVHPDELSPTGNSGIMRQ
jgi:hypothetical protein